jgi:hypothetical protein
MKQHEAIGLAIKAPLKANPKLVLITIIYKSDFATWEAKPMSASYIHQALEGAMSFRSVQRCFSELQSLGLIKRAETERTDRVKSIELNFEALRQSDVIRQSDVLRQSDAIRQSDVTITSESRNHYVTESYNNNQLNNQLNNQSLEEPVTQETRESLSGFSAFPPRPPRGTQTTQPRPRRYEDIAQQAQQTKRETYRVR